MFCKLNEMIDLFERGYSRDDLGGLVVSWDKLGSVWAQVMPASSAYPLRGAATPSSADGGAFNVTVRFDERILKASKIIWKNRELFVSHTPEIRSQGSSQEYLLIKTYAWKNDGQSQ